MSNAIYCRWCGLWCVNRETFEEHLAEHFGYSKHRCEWCQFSTSSVYQLDEHQMATGHSVRENAMINVALEKGIEHYTDMSEELTKLKSSKSFMMPNHVSSTVSLMDDIGEVSSEIPQQNVPLSSTSRKIRRKDEINTNGKMTQTKVDTNEFGTQTTDVSENLEAMPSGHSKPRAQSEEDGIPGIPKGRPETQPHRISFEGHQFIWKRKSSRGISYRCNKRNCRVTLRMKPNFEVFNTPIKHRCTK